MERIIRPKALLQCCCVGVDAIGGVLGGVGRVTTPKKCVVPRGSSTCSLLKFDKQCVLDRRRLERGGGEECERTINQNVFPRLYCSACSGHSIEFSPTLPASTRERVALGDPTPCSTNPWKHTPRRERGRESL